MRKLLAPTALVLLALAIAVPAFAIASDWPRSLAAVLVSEGGNDDDPQDPGGRTSRGIIQSEWTVWRRTHPGLPADVWRAPQDQIVAIYHELYWNHRCVRGDELPAGLDYTLFDYGVNSGVGRAGKVLRRILKLPANDCEITPEVVAAVAGTSRYTLIVEVNDERLRFLKGLRTWDRFGRGWSERVSSVRANSLRWASPAAASIGRDVPTGYGPGKAYDDEMESQP